ncbi:hypothetical protein L915_15837 [Phytophthora nicotianae]|uniref:Uncharacterized protein n=1 Tax=Phytophthora nicotianae TaxID=4792 RepID=W2G4X4_PHYNI|nr:hypothetical protein L915_15837 [Phytophthora nicotianae]
MLNPVYTPPLSHELSMMLLSDSYQDAMMVMQRALRDSSALTVGFEGATNMLSRSLSNAIISDTVGLDVKMLQEIGPESDGSK